MHRVGYDSQFVCLSVCYTLVPLFIQVVVIYLLNQNQIQSSYKPIKNSEGTLS